LFVDLGYGLRPYCGPIPELVELNYVRLHRTRQAPWVRKGTGTGVRRFPVKVIATLLPCYWPEYAAGRCLSPLSCATGVANGKVWLALWTQLLPYGSSAEAHAQLVAPPVSVMLASRFTPS
jgi:hypothetical protein